MRPRLIYIALLIFASTAATPIASLAAAAPSNPYFTSANSAVSYSALPSSTECQPDFGPNVYVFNPSMSQSAIQATVDAVATQQVSNQFGTQRYALLFEPGTYGSSATPLIF